MRHYHPITPTVVHVRARQALRHVLDWVPFHKSVSVDDLLDLLLLMAASTASLFATVRWPTVPPLGLGVPRQLSSMADHNTRAPGHARIVAPLY